MIANPKRWINICGKGKVRSTFSVFSLIFCVSLSKQRVIVEIDLSMMPKVTFMFVVMANTSELSIFYLQF